MAWREIRADRAFSSCFFSQMSAVGITENAKGDNKKFEIWCNSRDEVFIAQVKKKQKKQKTTDAEESPIAVNSL